MDEAIANSLTLLVMSRVRSKKNFRVRVEKFIKNAPRKRRQLKKVPGTTQERIFAARLKKVDAKTARKNYYLAMAEKFDDEVDEIFEGIAEDYFTTRERCDGYLSEGEMDDLFGK